jgi:hypothetical protein
VRSCRPADDLERCVDDAPSNHNKLVYVKKEVATIRNRDFLARFVWRAHDGTSVVVSTSEESQTRGEIPGVVRATYPSTMKIKRVGDSMVRLEYVIQPDFGGHVPAWAMARYMGSNLGYVTEIKDHFQSLRGLELWGEEDGEAVGEVLVTKTDAEMQHGKGESRVEARVRELMGKQRGLKELGQKHEWFEVLLAKVVANKLRPAGDSQAKICNMSVKEANVIGGALASCIAANLTAPAAVDEWILRYPAMGELERDYVSPPPARAS